MDRDQQAALTLSQALKEARGDILEEVVAHGRGVPPEWRSWSVSRQFWFLRKRARLSQTALAKRAGVAQSHVAKIENGLDVRLSTLRRLLGALGYGLILLPGPPGGGDRDRYR